MKKQIVIIMLLVLVALAVLPVQGQTITFANPGAANSRDIIAYFSNGSMAGFYNDTSIATTDGNESYIFVLKPLSSNPLTDPGDWLTNQAFPFVQSNVIGILLIIIFLVILAGRGK